MLVVTGNQHPEIWVPMKSPKGLTMENSLVIKTKNCSTLDDYIIGDGKWKCESISFSFVNICLNYIF